MKNLKRVITRTRVPFDTVSKVETATKVLESNENFTANYPFCQLLEHFFDRALLVKRSPQLAASAPNKPAVLSINTWDGREVISFYRV